VFGKSGRELFWDLLLTGGWAFYAAAFVGRLLAGGGLVQLGQVGAVTIFAALFLLRRPAQRSGSTWETLLALVGTFLPVAARPAPGELYWVGEIIQVVGLTGMAAAAISLGRSFGIAPADRGLRTTGLYGCVRHPLYAMEISFFVGYMVANPSWRNLAILIADTTFQILRITREERILQGYARYAAHVRWRLLPLVW
jgi:protein-S-isoprenylcysteine O-methyltransferase Ste14